MNDLSLSRVSSQTRGNVVFFVDWLNVYEDKRTSARVQVRSGRSGELTAFESEETENCKDETKAQRREVVSRPQNTLVDE